MGKATESGCINRKKLGGREIKSNLITMRLAKAMLGRCVFLEG
jgi:hypothetical protein